MMECNGDETLIKVIESDYSSNEKWCHSRLIGFFLNWI